MEETKKCITCGEVFPNTSEFFHKRSKNKLRNECKKCKKYKDKSRSSKRIRKIIFAGNKLKRIFCHYGGNKCSNCGYSKCYRSLTFHHLDPSTKILTLDSTSIMMKNIYDVYNELDKCILLCQNCHYLLHQKERELSRNSKNKAIDKYNNRKLKLMSIFNSECKLCLLKFDLNNIQIASFHHIDKSTKKFSINCRSLGYKQDDEIYNEVEKCELLCCNCHMELEDELSKNIS